MYNIIREVYVETKDIFGCSEWSMCKKSLYCTYRTKHEAMAELWQTRKQIEKVRELPIHYNNNSIWFFDWTVDKKVYKTVWYVEKV